MYRAEVRLKIILNRVNEEKVEKLEDCQFNYSFIQIFKFVSSFNVLHVNSFKNEFSFSPKMFTYTRFASRCAFTHSKVHYTDLRVAY